MTEPRSGDLKRPHDDPAARASKRLRVADAYPDACNVFAGIKKIIDRADRNPNAYGFFRNHDITANFVAWPGNAEKVRNAIREMVACPELCVPPADPQQPFITCDDDGCTVFAFNRGTTDYPVQQCVADLTVQHGEFCPFEARHLHPGPRHSFYRMTLLYESMVRWIQEAGKRKLAWTMVDDELATCPELCTNGLLRRGWLKDYTFQGGENFTYRITPPKEFGTAWRSLESYFLADVALTLGRRLFFVKRSVVRNDYAETHLEPIGKFLEYISCNTNCNFDELYALIDGVKKWFMERPHWAEVRIRDPANITSFSSKRCYRIDVSQEKNEAAYLDWCLNITGAGTITANKTFGSKSKLFPTVPVLVETTYEPGVGLVLKVVLNELRIFMPIYHACKYYRKHHSPKIQAETFSKFVRRIAKLEAQGKYLPVGNLLQKTTFQCGNPKSRALDIVVSPYGASSKDKLDCPEIFSELADECPSSNQRQIMVWEFGVWIVMVSTTLLRPTFGRCTEHPRAAIAKFMATEKDNKWFEALDTPLGHAGIVLTSTILSHRLPESFVELQKHPYFLDWVVSRELVRQYERELKNDRFIDNADNEREDLFRYVAQDNRYHFNGEHPLTLRVEWNTDSEWHNMQILCEFSRFVPAFIKNTPIRAFFDMKLQSTIEHGSIKESGYGPGVEQHAITLYSRAVNSLGLLKPENQAYLKGMLTHDVSTHWQVLGLMFCYAVAHDHQVSVDIPEHLLRIMVEGPQCYSGSLNDLAEVDEGVASNLVSLLLMTEQELQDVGVEFEFPDEPCISGPVTANNVGLYVRLKCKYGVLNRYDGACLRALHAGFNTTVSDHVRPTPELLFSVHSKRQGPTAHDIVCRITTDRPGHSNCIKATGSKIPGTTLNMCAKHTDGRICRMAAMGNFLRSCSPTQLNQFMMFVCARSTFSAVEDNEVIRVNHVKNPGDKVVFLPMARTCSKEISVFDLESNERSMTSEEAAQYQIGFNARMNLAIQNTPSFNIA
jgi:hypothetical protein